MTFPFSFLSFSLCTQNREHTHTQSTNSHIKSDRPTKHTYANNVQRYSVKWCPFCPRKMANTITNVSRSYECKYTMIEYFTNIDLINSFGIISKRTSIANCWQWISPIFFCSLCSCSLIMPYISNIFPCNFTSNYFHNCSNSTESPINGNFQRIFHGEKTKDSEECEIWSNTGQSMKETKT